MSVYVAYLIAGIAYVKNGKHLMTGIKYDTQCNIRYDRNNVCQNLLNISYDWNKMCHSMLHTL